MEKKQEFKVKAQQLYEILEKQNYKCALTGRELKPESTTGEFKQPIHLGGSEAIENIYLIQESVAAMKRYLTEAEVLGIAYDIIVTKGKQFGYTAKKLS